MVKTPDVKAVQVTDHDKDPSAPGEFQYYVNSEGRIAGMIYCCPCGCGAHGTLPFVPPSGRTGSNEPMWDRSGSEDLPTLSPSVHHIMNWTLKGPETHWHGWLRDGVWISC